MATNRIFEHGTQLVLAPTDGPNATVASGDPVIVGALPGVALTDGSDTVAAGGTCTVQTDGVFNLAVHGFDAAANAAIAAGDIVYWDATELNKDATNGVRFGYALEAVTAGATTTIRVKVGY